MSFDKQVYEKAHRILSSRRQRGKQTGERRREEVYQKLPQIARIDRELAQTSIQVAKTVLSEKEPGGLLDGLRRQNLQLQQQKRDLLVQSGYPADYLEPVWVCPVCRDTGYTDGKKCGCFVKILSDIARENLNGSTGLSTCSFSNFRLDFYPTEPDRASNISPREKMEQVYAYCRDYAQTFSLDSPSIFLYGATGLGKTHLSLAIADVVIARGFGVLYFSAQDLIREIETERFHTAGPERGGVFARITGCDLLILDDLGAEFTSPFASSVIYDVINSRLGARRPTIVSTNLTLKEMESKYSQRITSRILGHYKDLRCLGADIRMIKKKYRL